MRVGLKLSCVSRCRTRYYLRCVLNSDLKHSALTDEEVSQTKKTLLQISHRLRMQIPSELIEVSKENVDSGGEQDIDTLSSLRLVSSEHVVDLLKRVERTLTQIDDNRYGFCIQCGREIDKQTLVSDITVNTCANCKIEED